MSEGRTQLYVRLQEVTGGVEGMTWHAILSYVNRGMSDLKPATQRNYRGAAWRMLHHFGHWRQEDVEPTHCAQFLKWGRDNGSALTANRDKAFISSVWEFSMGEGWVPSNPWRGVRRNKERPAKGYVQHDALHTAMDRAPPELVGLFGTGYLSGMRQTDLRLFTVEQIGKERIRWIESKTGKANSSPISAALRWCLDSAAAHKENVARRFEADGQVERAATVRALPQLFVSARGLPWSEWGLQSALRRFNAGFKFRQLRSKAQSDRPERNILGHVGQMREVYIKERMLEVVK